MSANLVLLRAEYFRLSQRYAEGNAKRSEMVKISRKMDKIKSKIQKLVGSV